MAHLTVASLRKLLAGLADDVVVAVNCESGCEPHPLLEMHGINVEAALLTTGRSVLDADETPRPEILAVLAVFLGSDEMADLSTPDTWEPDPVEYGFAPDLLPPR